MKRITAVVKPFTLDDIQQALQQLGSPGMTVSEVEGFGQQRGNKEIYRGAKFATSFVNKAKIELIVADDQAEEIVDAIVEAACTGEIGDGKIWISSIDDIIRVRTGERGEKAI
ncbi:P-II family nitrogen regulator [Corynebacterium accolens]|uniref:P-II family nitrogen regulator n=1 Tax=Corynebacterium accolens TaxID=38284 RepID=UPI0025434484|nr:P-II family nitrogen regulator [Corynebacterium accolens]MDK4268483.1 P-II family nitrogen regulator [Corynebacterium accolens]